MATRSSQSRTKKRISVHFLYLPAAHFLHHLHIFLKVVALKFQKRFFTYDDFMLTFHYDFAPELYVLLRCGPVSLFLWNELRHRFCPP